MSGYGKFVIGLLIVGGIGAASYPFALRLYKERTRPRWRTVEVTRGPIMLEVTATGEIKPVQSVIIGSFVSGPIKEIHVDFNQRVTKGELMAKVDPRLYDSNRLRDVAGLLTRKADVDRVAALLRQAQRDEKRATSLQAENSDYIAQTEVDKYFFNTLQLKAQLAVAEAAVKQAEAALENSQTNLDYTDIKAPIDGIVIDRKIDPGQTLAASFQTPELFTIAPDMEKKMHIFASVDEADIGLIMDARDRNHKVHFTVDAWPDQTFEGQIEQVRLSSTKTQNVVTYPVVVAAPNPELKLLPGMTASLSFVVAERTDVVRLPRAALRFFPPREYVHADDRHLLDGEDETNAKDEDDMSGMTTAQRVVAKRRDRKRHVWVEEGEFLRAVEVEEGLSDGRYTEITSAQLSPGRKVVVGREEKRTFTSNEQH